MKPPRTTHVESKPVSNVAFSFDFFPESGNRSFDYFGKEIRANLSAYEALFERLKELSRSRLDILYSKGKVHGAEKIALSKLRENTQAALKLIPFVTNDSEITVFRFHNQDYRIICIKDPAISSILHIVAFDFDFSAYDHG